jgi:membrane fusion protein (multidrug efflux system)
LLAIACTNAEGKKEEAKAPAAEKQAPKARAVRVEVAAIAESRPSLDLVLPGEVEGSREAMLASPNGGYVEKVLADVGDKVKQGQSLAWVNKSMLDVQLQQAKVQLEMANTDFDMVERAGKSLPKARRDTAQFQKQAAEAQYQLAELNAQRAVVRAPFAGVVAERRVEQGEVLPPGGAVMRLVALDPLHVSLSVPDRDVVSLKLDMPAKVKAAAGSGIFEGKIERISPAADLNTRTFEVLIGVSNAEGQLRPGMIATVQIGVAMEGERLAIPQHVLVTRLDGNGVFVDEGSVARWRPLKLGQVVRGQVIVESGIGPGDRVVVTGHRELQDGDPLLVARSGRCCTNGQIVFEGE